MVAHTDWQIPPLAFSSGTAFLFLLDPPQLTQPHTTGSSQAAILKVNVPTSEKHPEVMQEGHLGQ